MKYTVIWKEQIDAGSPEQAVSKALLKLKPCYVGGAKNMHKGEKFQVEWKSPSSEIVQTSTTE